MIHLFNLRRNAKSTKNNELKKQRMVKISLSCWWAEKLKLMIPTSRQ
jgi:hypothetical protein